MKGINFKRSFSGVPKKIDFDLEPDFALKLEVKASKAVPHICPFCDLPLTLNHYSRLATFCGFCPNGDFVHIAQCFEPMTYNRLKSMLNREYSSGIVSSQCGIKDEKSRVTEVAIIYILAVLLAIR